MKRRRMSSKTHCDRAGTIPWNQHLGMEESHFAYLQAYQDQSPLPLSKLCSDPIDFSVSKQDPLLRNSMDIQARPLSSSKPEAVTCARALDLGRTSTTSSWPALPQCDLSGISSGFASNRLVPKSNPADGKHEEAHLLDGA